MCHERRMKILQSIVGIGVMILALALILLLPPLSVIYLMMWAFAAPAFLRQKEDAWRRPRLAVALTAALITLTGVWLWYIYWNFQWLASLDEAPTFPPKLSIGTLGTALLVAGMTILASAIGISKIPYRLERLILSFGLVVSHSIVLLMFLRYGIEPPWTPLDGFLTLGLIAVVVAGISATTISATRNHLRT